MLLLCLQNDFDLCTRRSALILCCHKSSHRIVCSCVTMILLIIFSLSIHHLFTGLYPKRSSDPELWINIGYYVSPFKYNYVFYNFSSIVDRPLMRPYFVSKCCFCTSTLQASVTLISISLAPVNPVGGTGHRGVARVHASPVHLAPLQHHARFRHPCSCRQPDAEADVCPRRSQTRDEESTSTCQKECLLLEMCTSATSVFIFVIKTQRWTDGKWQQELGSFKSSSLYSWRDTDLLAQRGDRIST